LTEVDRTSQLDGSRETRSRREWTWRAVVRTISVGAETLRPSTEGAALPAVGDRDLSHDYPLPVGHAAVSPAVPVTRAVKYGGVISSPRCEMTIFL